ncbi:MAG: HU family DNA-binding protein, partial [Rikenellaceae bacterium]
EEGNDIRLKNFGKFVVKIKKGRKYYNIQTGVMGATKDKRMIVFVQHRSLDSLHTDKEGTNK